MKKNYLSILMAFGMLSMLMTSCGSNSGLINQVSTHGSNTNIILQEKNFKVIGTVEGRASDTYILGFGGMKASLVGEAKKDMIAKAELEGTSKAIINVTLERHRAHFIFGSKHTIVVHGTVIEFTD